MNLFDQMESDSTIAELVIQQLDSEASRAKLSVRIDGDHIRWGLESDSQGDDVEPSPELFDVLGGLITMHKQAGTGLVGIDYEFEQNLDGSWAMGQSFEYGEPDAAFFEARAASVRARQRGWRRWFGRR